MREERDLFPDFNILISTFGVLLCIVRHELQVLGAPIALKLREDAHWDVIGHILQDLVPSVNLRLEREYPLHALIYTHFSHGHRSPDGRK